MFALAGNEIPGGPGVSDNPEDLVDAEELGEGASGGSILRGALRSPLLLLLIAGSCYRACVG